MAKCSESSGALTLTVPVGSARLPSVNVIGLGRLYGSAGILRRPAPVFTLRRNKIPAVLASTHLRDESEGVECLPRS